MLFVVGALSVLMGLLMGLLGGGGSVMTVPILVYIADQEPNGAIATALLVVGVASGVSVIKHAKMGNVRWRLGLTFGAFAMAGSYAGGLSAVHFTGQTLLVLFAILMLISGLAMIRPKKQNLEGESAKPKPAKTINWPLISIEGLVVGFVTGLVGAGGGFIIVPTLVIFAGIEMRAAIGTSLFIISMKSFTGLAGHLSHADVNPSLALFVTALAIVGALTGASFTAKIKPALLKQAFGVFVLVMAALIVARETTQVSTSPPESPPNTTAPTP